MALACQPYVPLAMRLSRLTTDWGLFLGSGCGTKGCAELSGGGFLQAGPLCRAGGVRAHHNSGVCQRFFGTRKRVGDR